MPDRIECSIRGFIPGTLDLEAFMRECVELLRAKGVDGVLAWSWESHGSSMNFGATPEQRGVQR